MWASNIIRLYDNPLMNVQNECISFWNCFWKLSFPQTIQNIIHAYNWRFLWILATIYIELYMCAFEKDYILHLQILYCIYISTHTKLNVYSLSTFNTSMSFKAYTAANSLSFFFRKMSSWCKDLVLGIVRMWGISQAQPKKVDNQDMVLQMIRWIYRYLFRVLTWIS